MENVCYEPRPLPRSTTFLPLRVRIYIVLAIAAVIIGTLWALNP